MQTRDSGAGRLRGKQPHLSALCKHALGQATMLPDLVEEIVSGLLRTSRKAPGVGRRRFTRQTSLGVGPECPGAALQVRY